MFTGFLIALVGQVISSLGEHPILGYVLMAFGVSMILAGIFWSIYPPRMRVSRRMSIRILALSVLALALSGCGSSRMDHHSNAQIGLGQVKRASVCVKKRIIRFVDLHHSMMDYRQLRMAEKACGEVGDKQGIV